MTFLKKLTLVHTAQLKIIKELQVILHVSDITIFILDGMKLLLLLM